MTDISPSSRPRRVGEAWVRREGSEAAVYNPATETLHRLNPSALAIWELCDGSTTIKEIVDAASEVTLATEDQIRRDVATTLKALMRSGLVVWSRDS